MAKEDKSRKYHNEVYDGGGGTQCGERRVEINSTDRPEGQQKGDDPCEDNEDATEPEQNGSPFVSDGWESFGFYVQTTLRIDGCQLGKVLADGLMGLRYSYRIDPLVRG